jgi:hypothetical protein
VGNVRERLAVSKQATRILYMEKFNLMKLNEVEAKEKYGTEISNRFAEGILTIKEDIKISRLL